MMGIIRTFAVCMAVLLGSTALAAAKPDFEFRHDSHRFDVSHKDDHHERDGKFEHHGYRERDQIEAFQHFWRRTGSYALSCGRNVWHVVFDWDRFHHRKHHKRHDGYTPPDHDKPVSPAGGGDTPHDGGYTPPDHGKPDGPQIADTSDKPDWHEPEPDKPVTIPEPGSLAILGSALLMGWLVRRRNRTS